MNLNNLSVSAESKILFWFWSGGTPYRVLVTYQSKEGTHNNGRSCKYDVRYPWWPTHFIDNGCMSTSQ